MPSNQLFNVFRIATELWVWILQGMTCACSEVKMEKIFKEHTVVWRTCSSEAKGAAPGRDGIYLDQAQWLSLLSLDPSVISVTCQTLKSSFCICPGRIRNGPANFCEDFRKEGYRLDRCLSFSLCKAYLKKSWLDERARSCYEQIWNCDWHQVREGQEENKVVKANKLQIPWVPWWWWWQVSHFLSGDK